jgi:hypothetical protein
MNMNKRSLPIGSNPTSPAKEPSKGEGESSIGNHCAWRGAFRSVLTIKFDMSILVWNA